VLSTRTEAILKSIVREYIGKATPVSSQSLVNDCELKVSPATIRNEMARLEEEGYITRPYPSAGSIPSDMGYRYYVESLSDIELPLAEQRLIPLSPGGETTGRMAIASGYPYRPIGAEYGGSHHTQTGRLSIQVP